MNFSILYMLISIFSISLSGFFAKQSMQSVGIYFVLLSRFFIPAIFISLFFIFFNRGIFLTFFKEIKCHLIRAASLTISQFSLFYAMKGIPMSEATALYNAGPLFIVIFSIFSGHKITINDFLSLIFSIIGVSIIFNIQPYLINKYSIFGLLSGFAYAVSQFSLHKSTKKNNTINIMFHVYVLTTVFSLIIFFISHENITDYYKISFNAIFYLGLIGLFSFFNQLFRGFAYERAINPGRLAPFLYLSIPITALLDLFFYHVKPSFNSLVGDTLIIVGSYVASIKPFPFYFSNKGSEKQGRSIDIFCKIKSDIDGGFAIRLN